MSKMQGPTCPCCARRVSLKALNTPYLDIFGVWECPRCGAVSGMCYKGESYRIVKPYWYEGPDNGFENAFYYDLKVIGSEGVERRHGWADKVTRHIVQVG